MPRRLLLGLTLAAVAQLTHLGTAQAELVVLTNGHTLKVSSFEVGGESARLVLLSGGLLTVPIQRIDRILDDEIEEPGAATPAALASSAYAVPVAYRRGEPVPATPYGELIYQTARRHDVSPALVAAMMRAESAFDPRALSHKGARGLMQLMPATAERFGVALDELWEPERNIEAGVRYLAWLRGRFQDDPVRVVAAYNAGEGAVDRHGGVPPFRETRGYVRKVFGFLGASPEVATSAALVATSGGG